MSLVKAKRRLGQGKVGKQPLYIVYLLVMIMVMYFCHIYAGIDRPYSPTLYLRKHSDARDEQILIIIILTTVRSNQ